MTREKDIETAIRLALIAEGVMVMKHHVDNRHSRSGLGLGVSDLVCVVPPRGRFMGVEVKTPLTHNGTSDDQKAWLAEIRKYGGVTGVASCVEDALAILEEAKSAC